MPKASKYYKSFPAPIIHKKISRKFRSSRPEVFLRKGALKTCNKFTGEHSCRSVISINLQSNFIEITFWHDYSLVNLLHIFRTTFFKNTSGALLLKIVVIIFFLSSQYYISIPPENIRKTFTGGLTKCNIGSKCVRNRSFDPQREMMIILVWIPIIITKSLQCYSAQTKEYSLRFSILAIRK